MTLLIISGIIALIGLGTQYKFVFSILFVEFLLMTGYQEIMLDPAIEWYPIEKTSYFYVVKSIIQAGFFMWYLHLDKPSSWSIHRPLSWLSRPAAILAGLSLVIIGYLWYTACMALYGFDNPNYVGVMTFISITQLLIGLAGVLHGYRHLLGNIFSHFDFRHHTRT